MIAEALRELPEAPRRVIQATWKMTLFDESIRTPLIIFLILRLFTSLAILAMVQLEPVPLADFMSHNPSGQTYAQALPPGSPFAQIVGPWHRWDTAWYVKVAIQGYRQGDPSFVFPPLYPMLISFLAPLCGYNYVLAAEVISTLCCFIMFLLLFKLIQKEFGSSTLARNTLIVLGAFPTAYYLVAGYTESLFIALTLGAWLAALHKQWFYAGILAFLGSLTRLQGAITCVPLAWIAYIQLRESGWRAIRDRLPAVVGAPLGTISYYAFIAINHIGTFDSAFKGEWQLSTRLPWESILTYIYRFQQHVTVEYEDRNAYALILFGILCVLVTITQRPSFSLYCWLNLFIILARYHDAPPGYTVPQFESLVRYSLMLFPCFIAAAAILSRWWQLIPYVIGGGYWGLDLLERFTHWRWVA